MCTSVRSSWRRAGLHRACAPPRRRDREITSAGVARVAALLAGRGGAPTGMSAPAAASAGSWNLLLLLLPLLSSVAAAAAFARKPAPAAEAALRHSADDSAAGISVDLRPFETEVLPAWLRSFQVQGAGGQVMEGAFRSQIGGPQAVYGTADVIHLLSTVNQMNFSDSKRDAWAATLASFQNVSVVCTSDDVCPRLPLYSRWPGFYQIQGGDALSTSGEPWHSTGDVTSSFYLLGRRPPALNTMYIEIASNRSLWEPTFLHKGKVLGIHKIIGSSASHSLRAGTPRESSHHAWTTRPCMQGSWGRC
jgi:hypothetical protein